MIQLPFIGSVLSKKKLHGDKVVTMQLNNWLVLVGLSVLTNTIHLVESHGEFRIQLAYRQPFFYIGGPLPPEHGYQWVNDACQLNSFALPVCHQRHGELKLHFFQNDHDKSSHQLSLRFQRHRCSLELDECQMGRRRRCYGRFVFGKCAVSQESYPLGIKAVAFISVGCCSSV